MKRIALYHLETLFTVARLGTFRAAAERMNTTQPAISARIRELEAQLGVTLFEREGRNMVLNSRGRMLVRDSEPRLAALEESLLSVSNFKVLRGTVRLGAGEIAAASCLPGFVQKIETDLTGVVLEIELDLTARLLQQLLSRNSDIVLLAGPVATPSIQSAGIGSVQLVWLANPAIAKIGAFAQPLQVWSLPSHSPLHAITLTTLEEFGVDYRSISTCNNVQTLIEIIQTGNGMAVLPQSMVRKELSSGALVEILPRPSNRIYFEVAIRKNEQDPVILELFRRAADMDINQAVDMR